MSRPACANPANIHHVVKPPELDGSGGRYCYQECVCGEIVSGNQCAPTEHADHPEGCTCAVTPAYCIDCDAEFTPTDPDEASCPECVAGAEGAPA